MTSPRIVVLGGSGLVGSRLCQAWRGTAPVVAPSHVELDVLDDQALETFLASSDAEVIVNAVAWADVDGAEGERGNRDGRVYQLNARLPDRLAHLTRRRGQHLVHLSTDYVFDGALADRPYSEDDPVRPLNWYATTKADGEQAVLAAAAETAAVVRLEMPFTARPAPKMDVSRIFQMRLLSGQRIVAVRDQRITPVLLDVVADALWQVVAVRHAGLLHVASTTWTTPYDYAQAIARRLGLDPRPIEPTTFDEFVSTRPAPRPRHSWLAVSMFEKRFGRGILRSFDDQLVAWSQQLTEPAR